MTPNETRAEVLAKLAEKWEADAEGVDAMGYSQQADRIRACADELTAALATVPPQPASAGPEVDIWSMCPECGPDVNVDEDGCCRSCGNGALLSEHAKAKLLARFTGGPR